MFNKSLFAIAATAATNITLAAAPAQAIGINNLGVDIESGGSTFSFSGFTIGWQFDVTETTSISHLGFWDEGGDGLLGSHDVGLWTSGGVLLTQAVVSNASSTVIASNSGFGNWIFEELDSSIELAAGTYVVGGVTGNDLFRYSVDTITLASPLANFDSSKFAEGSLVFPDQEDIGTDFCYFGANILIADTTPVPEPLTILGSVTALGFGALFKKKLSTKQDS